MLYDLDAHRRKGVLFAPTITSASLPRADQEAKRYVDQTREVADPKPYNRSGPPLL
jgi:hypothetical protein